MFIKIDEIINGENTYEELYQKFLQSFDNHISYCQSEIERLKQKEDKKDVELVRLLTTNLEDLTVKEQKRVLDIYNNLMANSHKLHAMITGEKSAYTKIKNATLSQLKEYQEYVYSIYKESLSNSDIEYNEKQIKLHNNYKANHVWLSVNKQTFFENYNYIEQFCTDILKSGKQIKFVIEQNMVYQSNSDNVNYYYTPQEFDLLVAFNNKLRNLGNPENIKFNEFLKVDSDYEFDRSWDINDVAYANQQIQRVANYIKSKNYTPYESMMFIHKYITSHFGYKETGINSQEFIVGAFKNNGIICSGYASLTKAIVDALGNPNLSCDIIGCELYTDSFIPELQGGHCQCVVHINDSEYSINGTYINDACWDSKTPEYPKGRGLAHFMYPVEDLMNLNNTIYTQKFEKSRYDTIIFNIEKTTAKLKNNSKFKETISSLKLKNPSSLPDVVQKYRGKSKPISYDKIKKALTKIYNNAPNKQFGVEYYVEQTLKESIIISAKTFNKKSQNELVQKANNLSIESQPTDNLLHSNDHGGKES